VDPTKHCTQHTSNPTIITHQHRVAFIHSKKTLLQNKGGQFCNRLRFLPWRQLAEEKRVHKQSTGATMGYPEAEGGNSEFINSKEEPCQSEDGFVDDDSSSLPPDHFDANGNVKAGTMKSSEQSEQGTAPTAAMTSSLAASISSFSFEITLPPPAEVSPLSCRESVVTAMMARPLDRALEQRGILARPHHDEYSAEPSTSERRRSSHHRRTHKSGDDHSDGKYTEKRHRSRSIHAKSRRDLSHVASETSDPSQADLRTSRRSRSEKPTSRRTKSTDGRRLSSSRSKSRDIASDEKKRRHRSKSRSAHGGDRSTREFRRPLTIASIKEEVEEALNSPNQNSIEKKSSARQRSRSRQRSPPPPSETRSSSKSRERSPSSSGHQSRSKPTTSSPSKSSLDERRSSSRNPSGSSSRDRSKSRLRHRSRSRSHSRTREETTEEEARQYLAMLSGLHPTGGDGQQGLYSSSKPSFLSRLAESNQKTEEKSDVEISREFLQPSKSVRWGESGDKELSSPPTSTVSKEPLLEKKQDETDVLEPDQPPRQKSSSTRERNRSKSRSSRHRSKSRKRTETEEVKKPESKRKMKWDELLNVSKSSFHFSTDSFCFDPKEDAPKAPSPLKTIQPNLNPVVLRKGVGSPNSAPNTTEDGFLVEEEADKTSVTSSVKVDAMIKDTRRRAEESRRRQAKLAGHPSSNVQNDSFFQISSPAVSETSRSEAKARLQHASAMILEKRKRREASKARQGELDLMTSPQSAMERSDNFEMCFPKSPFDLVQGGTQFSPALRLSNVAISSQFGLLDMTKDPLSDRESAYKRESSSFPHGASQLKKKMDDMSGKSESTMSPFISRQPELTPEPANEDHGDRMQKARVSRKERAAARRALRGDKKGASSNSKWKELSLKAEEIQKPESFKTKPQNASDRQEDRSSQRKSSIGRSKWTSLKGSIDFIGRMKQKTTDPEGNNN
jgi:hypothetical protein